MRLFVCVSLILFFFGGITRCSVGQKDLVAALVAKDFDGALGLAKANSATIRFTASTKKQLQELLEKEFASVKDRIETVKLFYLVIKIIPHVVAKNPEIILVDHHRGLARISADRDLYGKFCLFSGVTTAVMQAILQIVRENSDTVARKDTEPYPWFFTLSAVATLMFFSMYVYAACVEYCLQRLSDKIDVLEELKKRVGNVPIS